MTSDNPTDPRSRFKIALDERFSKPIGPRAHAARPSGHPVLVCAGDSITQGAGGSNWVHQVARTVAPAMTCVNAGVGGNVAWNLLARLDEIIACRPIAVTVLIGTNDALAQISATWSDSSVKHQQLPQHPTAQWYEDNLRRIVDRLKSETTADIALMSLPPLADAVDGRWHDLVAPYNAIIHEVATEAGVPVLPVHERVTTLITGEPARPWDGTRKLMGMSLLRRLALRQSWDTIARHHGFTTTPDGVHLNEHAAAQVAALVTQFVNAAVQARKA
ncbi:SGNH/GDSL hydrolase family protein [Streptomyces echinatus]|uniref:Lysophospholipase L1-like esterase n=1 Tax=Streptomyces echinatus TaxID=67293 RepID=A0A7W9PPV7_9ACTN|nr:GDSL-type esterase/lipase family protein [Streptomyces echinatus]MBB5925646.1 lysophospholipase L1-like esterase [Streptomyces echinatus]